MSTSTITPAPEETQALSVVSEARAIVISDQPTYDMAGQMLLRVESIRRGIVEHYAPLKQSAHETHRRICAVEADALAPVVEAVRILRTSTAKYQAECREREEAERRRVAEEARRKEEEIRRQQAAALREQQRIEEEARMKAAIEAEASGAGPEVVYAILDTEPSVTTAEMLAALEQPVSVAPEPVTPQIQRVAGVGLRDNWKFEVTDPNKVPREYLIIDEKKIGAVVRAMKLQANIPGVRVYNEPTTTMRPGGRF